MPSTQPLPVVRFVRVSAGDLRSARLALNLPSLLEASARRTSPTSSFAYVSYRTPLGDQVTNMPRGAAAFRAACGHLGLDSSIVHRLTFYGSMCTAHTAAGRIECSSYRVPTRRWWERVADMIWREEV